MKCFDPDSFRIEFAQRADKKLQEFYRAEKQHQKTELLKQDAAADDDLVNIAQSSAQAAIERISDLESRIDQYKQLTIEEIQILQEKLDVLLANREAMLERAYVLEDGRRVFKTLDGSAVFDEFGKSVSSDIIDPALIGDERHRWEIFSDNEGYISSTGVLLQEKLEFLDNLEELGEELDELKEALDQNNLTEDQLSDLEKRLESSIPESTRIRATALDAGDDIAKPTADFAVATAGQINLDLLKVTPINPTNNLST